MDIKQIQDKTYNELSNEEHIFLNDVLERFDLSIEIKNKIFVRFLFGCTVKGALKNERNKI